MSISVECTTNFGSLYVRNLFLVTNKKKKKMQIINKLLVSAKQQYQEKDVYFIFQKKICIILTNFDYA